MKHYDDNLEKYLTAIFGTIGSLAIRKCQGDGSSDNKKCKTKTEEENVEL